MACVIFTVSVLLCIATVRAAIPKGYIIDVFAECGKDTNSKPVLRILTDLDIQATVQCVNGEKQFTTKDNVHYSAPASYTMSDGAGKCILKNIKDSHQAVVTVLYGTGGSHMKKNTQIFTLSCTIDESGKMSAKSLKTKNGRISPVEKVTHVGSSLAKGKITLELQNVRDVKIDGSTAMDRWVSLYAVSDGTSGEKGLKAVSCYAINSKKKRYGILKSGCGDGLVIPKALGFITDGLKVRSPYFKSFLLEGDNTISYECTYVLCTGKCDGSSCQ